ncbi:hypothetical protein BJ322DRAFT_1046489 [Thelephora terrestris]|uniref:Uncharacterized protein n=1 Tax=Thelephora terrestris TaxID=56493 RepID=A0A9P6L910_9AGAM|nr:hypothetical protein BJ322DRAFT_1046489 [Thelephora terrestris]
MSRQNNSSNPSPVLPEPTSPVDRNFESPTVPSPSPHGHFKRESESSEGYPSWLPRRPPVPAPASTVQSLVGIFHPESGPSEPVPVGRKPTPRSIRIVSVADSQNEREGGRREATDQTRASQPGHLRVWSRATTTGMSPTAFSTLIGHPGLVPKFNTNGLNLQLLRNPSLLTRLHFYLLPIITFYHIPLQTFFDFNAVYILIQVARFPNPVAPGVPGSGKNWALGAAAYIACWAAGIFAVFLVYELVYSFYRRWRVKRPLIIPIYLSAPAFNLASMTSYNTYSFLRHIRSTSWDPERGGSIRDGIAETCWYFSQNTANIALLLPRAGLSLALLLTFLSSQPGTLALADSGNIGRDRTFFNPQTGTLSGYAEGVLIANVAWTAWRTLVWFCAWLGLWIFSGHGCAGLCGPRFRWQEEEAEKRTSLYSAEDFDDGDALPWSWRDGARGRIMEAFEFCKTSRSNKAGKKALSDIQEASVPFSGMEKVMAAVGLPTSPQPARRGALTGDLFEHPEQGASPTEISEKALTNPVIDFSSIIPPVKEKVSRKPVPSGPLTSLPYPFVGHHGAQVSSEEQVPFPPSPRHPKSVESLQRSQRSRSSRQNSNKENVEESDVVTNDEAEEDDLELEPEDEEEVDVEVEAASSDRRTSGSMSSLGQPIPSRYPFQYRRPRGRTSASSRSHVTPQSHHTRSTPSRSTQSTGNVETSDSPLSADNSSPRSRESAGIPGPPRHPNVQQRRGRAGNPPAFLVSPTPAYHRTRARTESGSTSGSPYNPSPVYESSQEGDDEERRIETPEPEGSIEEAEREDSVGLLSAGPSPRASVIGGMRHWPSSRSRHGSTGSQQSRSPSVSTRSRTQSLVQSLGALSQGSRSRAQSLIHSLGAASQSSLELVRSRANSTAQFSDSPHYSSHSDGIPSSPENNTFGQPNIRTDRTRRGGPRLSGLHISMEDVDVISNAGSGSGSESLSQYLSPLPMPTPPNRSRVPSSAAHSDAGTITAPLRGRVDSQTAPVPIPGRQQTFLTVPEEHPDLSSVPQSFVTAPATVGSNTTTASDETMPGQTSRGMHPERHMDITAQPM